ncbi:unnamed protein product [Polarella glacialis]|uniref:EF-hand domain-containing protein n=1 Tax=Polarella glacialis TaxID=89957 RepID=A0A813LWV2_POLGL|nr:unnamed protein product [Polarella glacialis]CAE8740105.1 unnamed protein product [Polarella glacialis]
MTIVEAERYRQAFDEFDSDGSGAIGEGEFESLLRKCAKVPSHVEIPAKRFRLLWKECDVDVDFEEFLVMYKRYFDTSGSGKAGGFETFYRTIRPVPTFPAMAKR